MWVCYILSAKQLQLPRLRRTNKFVPDPEVIWKPVKAVDYAKTGYDRGHLAPAADMSYAELPLKHSFYMSNISPQVPGCNRGIWKRLEMQARKWALQEQRLCIITGPLFLRKKPYNYMNGIPVPDGFFKIVLDLTPPHKMAAFVIPNDGSKKRLRYFSVSVAEVEKMTGFKFFVGFPNSRKLKRRNDFDLWKSSETELSAPASKRSGSVK